MCRPDPVYCLLGTRLSTKSTSRPCPAQALSKDERRGAPIFAVIDQPGKSIKDKSYLWIEVSTFEAAAWYHGHLAQARQGCHGAAGLGSVHVPCGHQNSQPRLLPAHGTPTCVWCRSHCPTSSSSTWER